MGQLMGYARVSTADQDLGLQLEALRSAGCRDERIFCDTASGVRTARPGLEACLRALAAGDTLVVWRLDRLGRSMTHLVTVIEELLGRHVGFRALRDGAIDTTTASGELMFHIFSVVYLRSADKCDRPLLSRLLGVNQMVIASQIRVAEPGSARFTSS